jgi:hypothetical protein
MLAFTTSLVHSIKRVSIIIVVAILLSATGYIVVSKLTNMTIPIIATGELYQYTSTAGRFSITYPKDWYLSEPPSWSGNDPDIVAYLSSSGFDNSGFLITIRQRKTSATTLEEVRMWGEQLATSKKSYKQLTSQSFTVQGEEMWILEYYVMSGSYINRCLDNYRHHEYTGYILSFCIDESVFEQKRSVFMQVINSFRYAK